MISEASALVSADGFSEDQSVALWLKNMQNKVSDG